MTVPHHELPPDAQELDQPHFNYEIEGEPSTDSQDEVNAFLSEHWGEVNIASRGKLTDASSLPRITARDATGQLVGLATYHPKIDGSCELVTIDSTIQGVGLGSGLLARVEEAAKAKDCTYIWLTTTNNNTGAQRF